jgi:hypothetical protein
LTWFVTIFGGFMTGLELKKIVVKISLISVVTIIFLFVGYMAIVLNWSYSKGERIGYVQKFSEKGWLCKTWEGELQMLPVPGAIPEKFFFSVRDKAVITKINSTVGNKIALSYEQHIGIPTHCLGESEYFIVDSRRLE